MTFEAEKELDELAIAWARDMVCDLDMCCTLFGVLDENIDRSLCTHCRHVFWAAVRGYRTGFLARNEMLEKLIDRQKSFVSSLESSAANIAAISILDELHKEIERFKKET